MANFLYGIHDPCNVGIFNERTGWFLVTESIGSDPNDHHGGHYGPLADAGFDVIVRLNNGYGKAGTIPVPSQYGAFAQRCANFVVASTGCHRWVIGNEPNHEQERPDGQRIYPSQYGQCFAGCREKIKQVQPEGEVIVAPSAVWNATTSYTGNERGDWVKYYLDCLEASKTLDQPTDAICLHAYSHGADPHLVTSEQRMDPPFQDRRFQFRAYQDYLGALPVYAQDLPVYITETNQNGPWLDAANTWWVQAAYKEIDTWNLDNEQQIRCLCLYRWARYDQWYIDGKRHIINDFQVACEKGYKPHDDQIGPPPESGDCWTEEEIRAIVRDEVEKARITWEM